MGPISAAAIAATGLPAIGKAAMNVGAHLTKRAELNPGLEALVDDAAAQRFTFAELDERANGAAHMLTRLGLTEGDRVAVLLPNGHHFVETFYGAARAGLVVVPLNLRLVANELSFMLRDSGATVLVFDGEHDTVVADLRDGGGTDDGTPVLHWVRVGANGARRGLWTSTPWLRRHRQTRCR